MAVASMCPRRADSGTSIARLTTPAFLPGIRHATCTCGSPREASGYASRPGCAEEVFHGEKGSIAGPAHEDAIGRTECAVRTGRPAAAAGRAGGREGDQGEGEA